MSHAATQVGKLRRNLAVAGFGAFTAFFLLATCALWCYIMWLTHDLQVPDEYDVYDEPYGEANFLMPKKRTDGRAPCAPLAAASVFEDEGSLDEPATTQRCVFSPVPLPQTLPSLCLSIGLSRTVSPTMFSHGVSPHRVSRRWALPDDDRGLASYVQTARSVRWVAACSKNYLIAQAFAAMLLGGNLLQRLGQNKRVSFVVDTLVGAWEELYHFFLVMIYIVVTYSVLGPLLIGDQMEVGSTPPPSLAPLAIYTCTPFGPSRNACTQ